MEDLTIKSISFFDKHLNQLKQYHSNNTSEAVRIALDRLSTLEEKNKANERLNKNMAIITFILFITLISLEVLRLMFT
jgi:hypothetical protein